MISDAEVRRVAAELGTGLQVVDLDYVQSCFLASLYDQTGAAALRFKGGTCLKKCYFSDYRFSQDLDFTATQPLTQNRLKRLLDATVAAADRQWQVDFGVRPIKVTVQDDEYGKESYQVRLYYRGPLSRRGDPQAIRLDVTCQETLAFPESRRQILHGYSDADQLADMLVPCYDVREVIAEKLRALAGQREYAISRDLFDVDEITRRQSFNVDQLAAALPEKFEAKGLTAEEISLSRLESRRDEFERDWERNLVNLLPRGMAGDFAGTWARVMEFIETVNRLLAGSTLDVEP